MCKHHHHNKQYLKNRCECCSFSEYILNLKSVKCWTANVCIYASKDPVIIMNHLEFICNTLFKDSHSRSIHICFSIVASNVATMKPIRDI